MNETLTKRTFRPEVAFRKTLESMLMGVVPSSATQLLAQTIDAAEWKSRISGWLSETYTSGTCKIMAGHYGSGKTHHLQLVRALAKQQNWVTATLELDPKSADPAKPHLVYEGLMRGLEFPRRDNGTSADGWLGFVDEIRHKWRAVETSPYFQKSLWFKPALEILRKNPHNVSDPNYVEAAQWLAGQYGGLHCLKLLHRSASMTGPFGVKAMPRTLDTSHVYAVQLATLAQVIRRCGYAGLAVIVDEAEHVRNFSVMRKERANSFFDALGRCAHVPKRGTPSAVNSQLDLPKYWKDAPHFALFVGLTPDPGFTSGNYEDACVFAHSATDIVMLEPPSPAKYRDWCELFWERAGEHLGPRAELLRSEQVRRELGASVLKAYTDARPEERVLRRWTKLAALAPATLLAGRVSSLSALVAAMVEGTKWMNLMPAMPWEAG